MFINKIKQPFQYEKIPLNKIDDDKRKRAKDTFGTIKRIGSYLMKEKLTLILVILMVLISSSLSLLGPYMIGMAIDEYIVKKQIAGLGILILWLIIIYIGHSLSIFLQNFWMVGIAQKTVYALRKDLFHKFHHLPISFFDKRKHGELMSRVTNDIDNINNTLNQSVIQIFSSVLIIFGTVSVMLFLSPILTLITMSIIPLLIIAMRWITKRTGPLYKLQQTDLGDLNGYIEETISGQHVIKTFAQEKRVMEEFKVKNKKLQLTSFWAMNFAGFIPKVMNVLNFISFGLIALFGGILAINGYITIGVIVIFTEYARQFTRPLNELSNQFNILLSAVAGAERVFAIIDEVEEDSDEKHAININDPAGHIVFENLSFRYENDWILKNLSFNVKPGETVAFVGHTGAGKTTIINLISRFYQYNEGRITLDGIDLNRIRRSSLRSYIAFVLQDTFLFNGTIRDNIRYGRLDATGEDIILAAKKANAHDFIQELPGGYDTLLDKDGSGISQGQKQLITLARAIIKDPSILILDEATSNIDTITEIKIQAALKHLMKNRTSIVIAHRLNTIKEADHIIMLENGKIIEKGSHSELINKEGPYLELYNSGATYHV